VAELAEARAARARLGRALREARRRKWLGGPAIVQRVPRIETPLPRSWPVQSISNVVVALATIGALAVLILVPQIRPPEAAAPAAAPELVAARVQVVESRLGGRGRTTAAVAFVAEPSPTPAPTASPVPSPSAEPTVAPRRSSAPVPVATPGGQPSGAPGGVPGGTPGGVPGGQPGGTGAATPIPVLRAPLSPFVTPPPAGFGRVTLLVVNGVNGEPLQDVCIVLGTGRCGPSSFYTNAEGIWFQDLPKEAATLWEIRFVLDKFTTIPNGPTHMTFAGKDITLKIPMYQVR